jgi:hypothetical protein
MHTMTIPSRLLVTSSFLLPLVLTQSTAGLGQTKNDIFAISTIPTHSRKALHERLDLFIEYQRSKQWDKAAALLGEFKLNLGGKERRYEQQEKQELPGELTNLGLISFEPITLTFSTRIYGQPLEQRAWTLTGCAEYKREQVIVRGKAILVIYRNKGEWFFSQLISIRVGGQPKSCEDKGPFDDD